MTSSSQRIITTTAHHPTPTNLVQNLQTSSVGHTVLEYYNIITSLQKFNNCARQTCTITDNRHSLRITSTTISSTQRRRETTITVLLCFITSVQKIARYVCQPTVGCTPPSVCHHTGNNKMADSAKRQRRDVVASAGIQSSGSSTHSNLRQGSAVETTTTTTANDTSPQVVAQSSPVQRLGIGLLGCGWFTRRAHIPALLRLERQSQKVSSQTSAASVDLQIVALWTRTQASADAAAKLARRPLRRHESQEDLIADAAVDVVIVALPIMLQSSAIEAVLRAGKHVISEKPAAANSEQASRLWRMLNDITCPGRELRQRYPQWCVLENWAYKPGVRRVSKLLRDGAVGEVCGYVFVETCTGVPCHTAHTYLPAR